jgi:hypothetical protein
MITEEEKRMQEAVYQAANLVKTTGAFFSREDYAIYLRRVQERLAEMKEALRQPPTDLEE